MADTYSDPGSFALSTTLLEALTGVVYIIAILGRTGDGKSSFGNLLAALLGHSGRAPFSEGSSSFSHTADPSWIVIGDTMIVDLPGLCDTGGVEMDEKNIPKIVTFLKGIGRVNAFVHVVNEASPRFDAVGS
jgi:GTP-binding protein EngB required for normal cell division